MQSVAFTFSTGRQSKTSLIKTVTADLSSAVTAGTALAAYTNAAIEKVTFSVGQALTIGEKDAEVRTVDLYALCLFRDADEQLVKVAIPAPIKSQFNYTSRGYAMQDAHGEALADILGALRGEALTFVRAYIVGKSESDA